MQRIINPLVSIIIPIYNRADLILETLQSVQNQSYQNWECIVIDDGSTDDTVKLVNSIIQNDNRIQFFKRNRDPKGAPTCRNIGLEKSRGEYIIFLDSDDLMEEFCIERRISYFEKHPGEDFLVFQSVLFNKDDQSKNVFWNISTDEDDLTRFMRLDALWPICGPIYKQDVLQKVQGFREDLVFWQDYELHLRVLLLKFSYKKLLELPPDIFIRRHSNESISQALPFATNKVILKKRTDFFLSIVAFINDRNIILTDIQKKTLWSVLFYFSSSFLIIHNNKKEFLKYWKQSNKALKIKKNPRLFSSFLAYLMFCRRYSIYFIKLGNIYKSVFKNYIADPAIMKKTNAGTEKFDLAHDSILSLLPLKDYK